MSLLNPVLLPPKVKAYLSQGERFIKWDDETTIASPVILRVDAKGYYLYWTYQSKEIEFLDITSIRDTRFGKFAKIPKNWAEDVLALVKHPLTANASRSTFLDKILVKLKMQLNPEGKIPVKNFFQMFPADRKRVEAALSSCHLPKGKNDAINPEDFPESVYKSFLMSLCPRPEIDEIFTSYHAKAKPYMTKEHLTKFINQKQRDSRLNSLLFPPARPDQVRGLIDKYEPSAINVQRGQLSPEGMVWFLCGPENSVLAQDKLLLYQDMTQPLNHYFINSSHNTYLTAGQFSGLSSAEMYRQVLLAGCRCVELDCWKGRPPDEEPIITHGFTMTTDIYFKEAIEAIAESAFKTSPYPVILSFENHVDSPRQQAKMAEYCRTMFGDMLLTEPLEKFPLKPGIPLPSPEDLRGKILIKNKKNQFSGPASPSKEPGGEAEGDCPPSASVGEGTAWAGEEGTEPEEEEVEEEEESGSLNEEEIKKMQSDEGTAGLEVTAYEEMSSLVNYIQPTKFISFEFSAQKNRSYVISSFTELKAYDLLSKASVQFVDYNKRQMSRIYPKGTRMDSSNYMPQMFWNAGCQMVALNFQTMDLPMQQNMALFEFNGQSGYLLKHEFMRRPDKQFNPFSVDRIDVVVATTLSITVISGQFLSERSVRTYVEVELFGLPGDPKRRYRTKLSPSANSINPVWKEEPFVFEKILMPELASLRVAVMEEGNRFLGHRIIPINALNSGKDGVLLCCCQPGGGPETLPNPLKLSALRSVKELRDLERRGARRWEELLQRGAAQLAELGPPGPGGCGGRRLGASKGSRKKRTPLCEEAAGAAPSEGREGPEGADARARELKDRLELELLQQGEERYECILKRKEQHVAEQIAKMMELAREKQAAELKTLKETLETDTKEVKKKLEAKRIERIQAMVKVTSDKMAQERLKREINNSHIQEVVQAIKQMTENLEKHQEKLEEKQAACLEQIREMEKQFQQEALAEYEARMKGLEAEVKESVRTCLRDCFPSEAKDKPERSFGAFKELCEQDPLTAKADAQESRL
ncbi:1-phosphatidylinositol--bisphosphate [Lynx pardinus]|uniref:Phosphoinositide phospholipase C n=1 Tax=Lynx pardinus TaxID=191816 RepID=A0A485MQY0_LYNPA|nr:1-phosphatidylinositol--bisphosphate [Lynx pardinus]